MPNRQTHRRFYDGSAREVAKSVSPLGILGGVLGLQAARGRAEFSALAPPIRIPAGAKSAISEALDCDPVELLNKVLKACPRPTRGRKR